MQRLSIAFGSLLVQRDRKDRALGAKNGDFLIRGRGARHGRWRRRAESCQSPPEQSSPWGRLGSVLYTCKRLRRMCRRFEHFWPISLSRPRRFSN